MDVPATVAGAEPEQDVADLARSMPYFYRAVGAPKGGLHQWQPYSRHPLVRGNGRGSRMARLILHEMRWREPPRDWLLRILAAVLMVLLHLLAVGAMMVERPPGQPPGAGTPQVAAVQVRLINQPRPPPSPPPIKLPKRGTPHHVPATPAVVKRAPVAAMPPIPVRKAAAPKVTLKPAKPRVALVPNVPPPPHVTASPPTTKPSAVALPPPRIVEEISNQALPAPQSPVVQTTPVPVASPESQPIPTRQSAPEVTLGKSRLDLNAPATVSVQPVAPSKPTATLPSLPSVNLAEPRVRITAAPTPTPSVIAPEPVPQAIEAPSVSLAPIPQAPATVAVPDVKLPVAHVTTPQAPRVTTPTIRVEAPSVANAAPAQPALPASSHTPQTVRVPPAASWAPANDHFHPITGQPGQSMAAVPHPSDRKGRVERLQPGNSNVMTRNTDHLGYKSTIFQQYWAPDNESILDEFLRRFIEKLTVTHTFTLAPGIRVHCVLGPLAVFAGCAGDPPRPPSAKGNDPRLDMAPARRLAPGLPTPAPAASATAPRVELNGTVKCEVARVAGGPPPSGCPGGPASSNPAGH